MTETGVATTYWALHVPIVAIHLALLHRALKTRSGTPVWVLVSGYAVTLLGALPAAVAAVYAFGLALGVLVVAKAPVESLGGMVVAAAVGLSVLYAGIALVRMLYVQFSTRLLPGAPAAS